MEEAGARRQPTGSASALDFLQLIEIDIELELIQIIFCHFGRCRVKFAVQLKRQHLGGVKPIWPSSRSGIPSRANVSSSLPCLAAAGPPFDGFSSLAFRSPKSRDMASSSAA